MRDIIMYLFLQGIEIVPYNFSDQKSKVSKHDFFVLSPQQVLKIL